MKTIIFLALFVLLSGCATTALKSQDCPNANWREIGVQDGKQGRYPFEIARHQKICGQTLPNRELWEQGRQEGLKSHCTKSNAYTLGQHGIFLNAVCPEEGLEEIQNSHALGFNQYYQRQRLSHYHNPPFYGYPPPFHYSPLWIW